MFGFIVGTVFGIYITGALWRYKIEIDGRSELPFADQWTATVEALKWPWMVIQTVRDIWR